MSAPKSEL